MGGISNAVGTYAPAHSGDEQFHQDVFNHFQKMASVNEIASQGSTVVTIVDSIF